MSGRDLNTLHTCFNTPNLKYSLLKARIYVTLKTVHNLMWYMKPLHAKFLLSFTGCIRRGNHSLGYQSGKGRNVSIAYLVYDLEGIGFHYICIPESYFETKYRNLCAFGFIQSSLQSVNINLNKCFFYVQLQ